MKLTMQLAQQKQQQPEFHRIYLDFVNYEV